MSDTKKETNSGRDIPVWADKYASNFFHPVLWAVLIFGAALGVVGAFGASRVIRLMNHNVDPSVIVVNIIGVLVAYSLSLIFGIRLIKVLGAKSQIVSPKSQNFVDFWCTEGKSKWRGVLGAVGGGALAWLLIKGINYSIYYFSDVAKVPGEYIMPAMAAVLVPIHVLLVLTIFRSKPLWIGLVPSILYAVFAVLALFSIRLSIKIEKSPADQYFADVMFPMYASFFGGLLVKYIYSKYAYHKLKGALKEPIDGLDEGGANGRS